MNPQTGEPMTDYNPDNYNRDSFANIMQFIFADLMIRYDRKGKDAFLETNKEVVKLRKHIEGAYRMQAKGSKDFVAVNRIAEGVLLWMREGATVENVLNTGKVRILERGKKVGA